MMIEVIGVTFKQNGKIYYFSPDGKEIKKGINVIVTTERGMQFGTVEIPNTEIDEKILKVPLAKIVRIAGKRDYSKHLENIKLAKKALSECKKMVEKEKIDMMILDANYTFDRNQLLFTFLADNRVDFRNLAKNLGSKFKTRIELRQLGVRDKAREVGGYGCCGRPLCCSKFLTDFDSVSINMAKTQNIALNPTKINGVCGRLLCCLKYENDIYKEYGKNLPKLGKKVVTDQGEGKVISTDILKQTYRVDVKDYGIVEVDLNESK